MSMFCFVNSSFIEPILPDNYWAIVPQKTYKYNTGDTYLTPLIPTHPILNGVKSFDGGSSSFRGGIWSSSAVQVASWTDGTPLVGVVTVGSTPVVSLSIYPPSNSVNSGNWLATTDGARLMANALAFTMNTGSCSSHTHCSGCTSNGCQWCLDTKTCSTPSTSCPDRIVNPSDCPADCTGSKCSSCLAPEHDGLCSWCLDTHSCIPQSSSNNCKGEINNIKFCPSISFN